LSAKPTFSPQNLRDLIERNDLGIISNRFMLQLMAASMVTKLSHG
jgi:hypothetical protein